jgi:hypothetical protein
VFWVHTPGVHTPGVHTPFAQVPPFRVHLFCEEYCDSEHALSAWQLLLLLLPEMLQEPADVQEFWLLFPEMLQVPAEVQEFWLLLP